MRFNCLKLFSLFLGVIFFAVADLQAQHVVRVYMSGGRTAVYDRVDSVVCTVEEQEIYADGKIYRTLISEVDSVVYDFTSMITSEQLVDLGLSVKWAGWNVGANSPEEYGGYYAWGELEEKDDYSREAYQYWDNLNEKYVFIGKNISGTQYDVAHVNWGASWRMPTSKEIEELINNCDWEWTTYHGVNGQKVTGPNGNCIFFPVAGYRVDLSYSHQGAFGYYALGTSIGSRDAGYLYFNRKDVYWYVNSPFNGLPVRPVSGKLKLDPMVSTVDLDTVTENTAVLHGFTEGILVSNIDCGYGFLYGTDPNLLLNGKEVLVGSNKDGNYTYTLNNLIVNTTYYYCAYISVNGKKSYGDIRSFTTKKKNNEITPGQLVDLGLSVKWAGWNVGASKPEEFGSYYA